MYNYSAVTLTALHAAGWTEDHHFDTANYVQLLHEKGYSTFPSVIEFLSKYGGLKVGRPSWRFPGYGEYFHFQVDTVLPLVHKFNIDSDAQGIGTILCPIGDAYDGSMPLVMNPLGIVYISAEGLHDLGGSGEDAIEALCTNRPVKGFADDHI